VQMALDVERAMGDAAEGSRSNMKIRVRVAATIAAFLSAAAMCVIFASDNAPSLNSLDHGPATTTLDATSCVDTNSAACHTWVFEYPCQGVFTIDGKVMPLFEYCSLGCLDIQHIAAPKCEPGYVAPRPPSPTASPAAGKDTCKAIELPVNQCLDIFSAPMADIDQFTAALGGSESTISVVDELAKPILTTLVKASPELKDLGKLNVCLGTFKGDVIAEPPEVSNGLSLSDLGTDQCDRMPLNKDVSYTVLAMAVSPAILDSMGICTVESEIPVSFCVAFGYCDSGLPTFAIQFSGPFLGCFAGNTELDVSTDGISEIAGEAVTLGIKSIGFGLSASGAFAMEDFQLWSGDDFDLTSVESKGNIYQTTEIDLANTIPKEVVEYLEVAGSATMVVQLNSGNLASEVQSLFDSSSPLKAVTTLAKASVMGQMKVTVAVKLDEMTKGLLPNLDLGDVLVVNGLLSSQVIGDGSVLPGAYFYAAEGMPIGQVLDSGIGFLSDHLGDVINKIAGHSDTMSKAVEACKDLSGSSKTEFAVFVNTAAFGILVQFPVGDLFDFLGAAPPLGTIGIQCQFQLSHMGVVCGVMYNAPAWAAALWKDAELVIGPVRKALSDAKNDLAHGIGEGWTVMSHGVSKAAVWSADESAKAVVYTADKSAQAAVYSADHTAHDVSHAAHSVSHAVSSVFSGRRRRFF